MGDSQWSRSYGDLSDCRAVNSVVQTSDGGYALAGSRDYSNEDALLIKTDAAGETLWTRTYGGPHEEWGSSIRQTRDGGYIIAGGTWTDSGARCYLVRTDSIGDSLWTRTYDGYSFTSVLETADSGYMAAGSYDDVRLVRTDAGGNMLWTRIFHRADWESGHSVQPTSDGGFIITGETRDTTISNWRRIYLIKTDANGSAAIKEAPGSTARVRRLAVRPDPFVSFTVLPGCETERVTVSDISGRQVGTFKGDRIGEGLPPGVYFIRSEIDREEPIRIVKLK